MKQLSNQAKVAKLLKQKAREFRLGNVTAKSESFTGGNSVNVKFDGGTDEAVTKFKDFASRFQLGRFNGMEDIYEYSNCRDDIPQTKYLFINDNRAEKILGSLLHYQTIWIANGDEVNFAQFMYRIKQQNFDWMKTLSNLVAGVPNIDFQIKQKGN